jgi:L-ascorbate metabolism protein UlaG (beta-lactamase superfamily)
MMNISLRIFIYLLFLLSFLPHPAGGAESTSPAAAKQQVSDHFDGNLYFNPGSAQPPPPGQEPRGRTRWILGWLFGIDRPAWPETKDPGPGPAPVVRVPNGKLAITPVGHGTFLIQLDGLNILTDPIWSERCSPVPWAGPRRHREAGIRFEDLPPIDVALVSHNHYDHFDLPTLTRLAEAGTPRAVVPLGNRNLIRETGIPQTEELDWWQSVRLSPDVTVTLVPAQHFSSRTLWDRNETLWGGFVVSGASGTVFYAGDTGYGPHFHEIARRFSPIHAALLPISPFRPQQSDTPSMGYYPHVHMGPAEAVQTHTDLGAQVSIAAHFRVFQLGFDGFDDAVSELAAAVKNRGLPPDAFIVPISGRAIELDARMAEVPHPEDRGMVCMNLKASSFIAACRGVNGQKQNLPFPVRIDNPPQLAAENFNR